MTLPLKNKKLLTDRALIGEKWIKNSQNFNVLSPLDGSVIGTVPDLKGPDTCKVIVEAENAFKIWSKTSAKNRAIVLMRWFHLIVKNAEDLAIILTAEQGKPLAEAKGEILYGASFIEWFAEEGKRAYGDIIPSPIPGAKIFVSKEPIGVCAAITPWNFPSAMITRKVAPALAAGCTVICKPAEDTPLSALALAVLAQEAGIPAGVFNVITGKEPVPISAELCKSNVVRHMSFTGSTPTGKIIMRQCSHTIKKLALELGGNAPFIVFDDADVDAAVDGAITCKFRNAGQTCVSANRIFVQEGVYDEFADKFANKVMALKIGSGFVEGVDVGPMINKAAVEKVQDHVNDAVNNGAKVTVGGQKSKEGDLFFEPTVVIDVTDNMKFAQEETFGPAAPIFKFSDADDVIAKANATNAGLASYFYSKDMARIWKVADALEYGMVAVNTPILSTEVAPFGGVKESGLGREGSKYGLEEYLEMKYILMSGL